MIGRYDRKSVIMTLLNFLFVFGILPNKGSAWVPIIRRSAIRTCETHRSQTGKVLDDLPEAYPSSTSTSMHTLCNKMNSVQSQIRRDTFHLMAVQALVLLAAFQQPVQADVTEESKSFFANTAADALTSPSLYLTNDTSETTKTTTQDEMMTSPSDEITISIPYESIVTSQKDGGLGMELADVEFRSNLRVYIKSIRPGSLASKLGIQKDWIVVRINGQSAERTNAQGVALMVSMSIRSILQSSSTSTQSSDNQEYRSPTLDIVFRDPYLFQQRLKNLSPSSSSVTTQVAPARGNTSSLSPRNLDESTTIISDSLTDQRVTVTQLVPPKLCTRKAQIDDLLEISYVGRVVESGQIFDGSSIKINEQGIPGRGNDVSIFFVLGKQPMGQFPPGWDVGLLGMCVGERRRLILPPALAYGSTGIPRRGIPPNATLQYDITLVSLNGLAIPQ